MATRSDQRTPAGASTAQPARQSITPELRDWIAEQASAGCSPAALRQSLRAAGWDDDVAAQALADALQAPTSNSPEAHHRAPPLAVPAPLLADSPPFLDAGDRQVGVLLTLAQPRLVVFANLLAPEECDALIAAAAPRMARSLTVATQTGGDEINDDRTSDGMFFQQGESPLIQRIEDLIARLLN